MSKYGLRALALLAVVVVLGGLGLAQRDANERLLTAITGGDNYCYLRVDPSVMPAGDGLPLVVANPGKGAAFDLVMFVSPAAAQGDSRHPDYRILMKFGPGTCYPVTAALGMTIPNGQYRIDISTRTQNLTEILTVARSGDGELVQWIEIYRDGKLIKRGNT
jgi:hypothetical protein